MFRFEIVPNLKCYWYGSPTSHPSGNHLGDPWISPLDLSVMDLSTSLDHTRGLEFATKVRSIFFTPVHPPMMSRVSPLLCPLVVLSFVLRMKTLAKPSSPALDVMPLWFVSLASVIEFSVLLWFPRLWVLWSRIFYLFHASHLNVTFIFGALEVLLGSENIDHGLMRMHHKGIMCLIDHQLYPCALPI
jgi:hypothetical protein